MVSASFNAETIPYEDYRLALNHQKHSSKGEENFPSNEEKYD
jgi:hypothetical protein